MRNNPRRFLFCVLLFSFTLYAGSVYAQANDPEYQEWLKKRQEQANSKRKEFDEFLSRIDREFGSFLKQRWKEFNAYKGLTLYKEQKPNVLPAYTPNMKEEPQSAPAPSPPAQNKPAPALPNILPGKELPKALPEIPKEIPKELPTIEIPKVQIPEVPIPVIIPKTPPPAKSEETEFVFYGQKLKISIPQKVRAIELNEGLNEKAFSDNWIKMSSDTDPQFLKTLADLKKQLNLNDWSYALLVQQITATLYKGNNARLMNWFILNKSGLKTKIGYSNTEVYVMINPAYTLYGMPYYKLGKEGERYYPIADFAGPYGVKPAAIRTYEGNYPDKQASYDLKFKSMPNIQISDAFERTVREKLPPALYTEQKYSGSDDTQPQSEFDVYYSADVSPAAYKSVIKPISDIIKPMSETDKINFLLRFAQNFTQYKTDIDQFGKEVYMFPDQAFFYPASDCDDRVSVFSYLVRSLTDNDIVYLLYPNHIATAVSMKSAVNGRSVKVGSAAYYVADPTYIGADVGMVMPDFKSANPKVFAVK
ncbi:hypothetical protein CHS0354_030099 [Potamilus streckersoni]|uniref:Uncharacterized protein n=1 Tax=Potamilus streckersoni TaxID=2493646 RepID=A0AAE0RLL4_9BIVA|nr:hypothetical protein CHS0354_030099 [Potamilus streckersoni]